MGIFHQRTQPIVQQLLLGVKAHRGQPRAECRLHPALRMTTRVRFGITVVYEVGRLTGNVQLRTELCIEYQRPVCDRDREVEHFCNVPVADVLVIRSRTAPSMKQSHQLDDLNLS